jgi:hypothetical protein
MTGRAVEDDPFVRTALQLLPVPAHEDDFWTRLDAALDAEPSRARSDLAGRTPPLTEPVDVAGDPAPEPALRVVELEPDRPLGLVPPGVRRRSNVVLSAVAVAAAVVVVVAGTSLVRERSLDPAPTDSAAAPSETTADPAVTATSTTTSVTTLASPRGGDLPTEAVLAWVAALGSGDLDAAWDAMGPASQAHFGSQSAFEAEGSGLAEGYGAWSAAEPDVVHVTSLTASGDGEVVVVTLVGTVEQEGSPNHRADAFPVRVVGGEAHIEPFAFAGEVEIVVPEGVPDGGERPVVASDDALVVVVPRGVEDPVIRLDDGPVLTCGEAEGTELTELEDAPGQRCVYRPEGGIDPGDRVLTVAFLSTDGTGISAQSVRFEAA